MRAAALLVLLAACASPAPREFVNITFTTSVDASHYAAWDFDLARCVDSGDPRVADDEVRSRLLVEIERYLTDTLEYARVADGEDPDFLVYFEVSVDEARDAPEPTRVRAKLFLFDVATQRLIWRGERKAYSKIGLPSAEREVLIRAFVEEVLQFVPRVLERLPEGRASGPRDALGRG